MKTSNTTT